MGHFLAEQHQQALLRRGEPPFQRKAAEVQQHRKKRQREAIGQPVDDPGQQQRRQQRCRHRGRRAQKRTRGQQMVRPCRHPDGGKYAIFLFLHVCAPRVWFSYSWRYIGSDAISSAWVPTAVLPSSMKITLCSCGKWYSRWEIRNTTLSLA